MPAILGTRGEQKIKLETASEISGEDVFVTISKTLLAKDWDLLPDASLTEEEKKDSTYALLAQVIISWDFVTADGNIAPITAENVAKIPFDDLLLLQEKINWKTQVERVKKNSSYSTSLPEEKQPAHPSNISS